MNAWFLPIIQVLLFVIFAPLLAGLVKKVKCVLQNRQGPPVIQPYRNLYKLFNKNLVIADHASFIFRMTPYVIFGITIVASAIVPLITSYFPVQPIADVLVLVGLFALARFFLALAGLDIGTAFGGMGSSREMMVSAMAEPALLMAFFTVALIASSTNLSVIVCYLTSHHLFLRPSLIFAATGFALVAIAETGRIPVDNPATHLELTMIHEAMILEYSGRHLALIEWSAQIKFMLYGVLLINLFFPFGMTCSIGWQELLFSAFMLIIKLMILAVLLAVSEMSLAKFRLFRVPYLLNIAFLLGLLGLLNHIILEVY